jgi:hypothetical protein
MDFFFLFVSGARIQQVDLNIRMEEKEKGNAFPFRGGSTGVFTQGPTLARQCSPV